MNLKKNIYKDDRDKRKVFFKNIKQNLKFLFPIGFGALVGIILFGNILKYLFLAYPIQIKFIFIGWLFFWS